MSVKPVLQALLIADHIYEDRGTGKRVVAGIFNALMLTPAGAHEEEAVSPSSPGDQPATQFSKVRGGMSPGSPFAYISLTDIHAAIELELRFTSVKHNQVFLRCKVPVSAKTPLDTIELAIPMPMLPVPEAGIYALELLYRDELLGAVRITAVPAEAGEKT